MRKSKAVFIRIDLLISLMLSACEKAASTSTTSSISQPQDNVTSTPSRTTNQQPTNSIIAKLTKTAIAKLISTEIPTLFKCKLDSSNRAICHAISTPDTVTPTLPLDTPSAIVSPVTIPVSTFDVTHRVTHTPAPRAQCPPASNLPVHIDLNQLLDIKTSDDFEQMALNILNKGQAIQFLQNLNVIAKKQWGWEISAIADLTGDGAPEFLVEGFGTPADLFIFSCQNGKYQTLTKMPPLLYSLGIKAIGDLNLDGTNELVVSTTLCEPACIGLQVYEWDGQQFQSLVRNWHIDLNSNTLSYGDWAELMGFGHTDVRDTDNNGTKELVFTGGIFMMSSAVDDGPYRSQTDIYWWDGHYFTFHHWQFDPPVFRFQAVQDGDIALSQNDYVTALASYQAAIFNDQLAGWDINAWLALDAKKQTPDATLMPFSQVEYDQLSAYSRYQIMLIHLLQGEDESAKIVYDTLKSKYPDGNAGHLYVDLATTYMVTYLSSHNMNLACQAALAFGDAHPTIFDPIRSMDHGFYSEEYLPSLCMIK